MIEEENQSQKTNDKSMIKNITLADDQECNVHRIRVEFENGFYTSVLICKPYGPEGVVKAFGLISDSISANLIGVCEVVSIEDNKNYYELADKLRAKLVGYVGFCEGLETRLKLHKLAKTMYIPSHTPDEYLDFMNANPCDFEIIHPQSMNHPWCYSLFISESQYVYGDCVEQCLDKVMKKMTGNVE